MTCELVGRCVAVLAEDLFEDVELLYPYYRLLEGGAAVSLVGSGRAATFHGKHGVPITPDVTADETDVGSFDAVVIPGGFSPDFMRRSSGMVGLVRDLGSQGKPVAAICHGPSMLVSAGLVDGRNVTSFFSIKDDLVAAGANYVDQDVVVDGNLITSRTPADLPAFMARVVAEVAAAPGRPASTPAAS